MSREWRKAIDARFAGRDNLTNDELRRQFWADLPECDVLDALCVVQAECEVTVGLMRPTDAMTALFDPPPTKNPFRWMEYQVHGGDADFELSRQLTKRLKKYGRVNDWHDRVKTLDDFVRAWSGLPPSVAATEI
jgi:hypothetical protein